MKPQDFKRIEDHFSSNNMTVSSARFAFSKYIESVESGIEAFKRKRSRDPDANEVRSICDGYLTSSSLQNYRELAKINDETEEKRIASKYSKDAGVSWWARAVVSGVLANFLFLSMLLLSFAYGKSQWESILAELDLVGSGMEVQSRTPDRSESDLIAE